MEIDPQEPTLDLRQLCDLPPDAKIIDVNGWQDPDDKGFPCYVYSESARTAWRIDISIKVGEPFDSSSTEAEQGRRHLRAVQ